MAAERWSIPTNYRGIAMRSRLEARWAAFFDELGWKWTYEPFDGDRYIPDFLIHGERPLLIEIRPCVTVSDYEAQTRTMRIEPERWAHDLLVLGCDPLPSFTPFSWRTHRPAGLLGECLQDVGEPDWAWDAGLWTRCARCREFAIFHETQSWRCRPCGCYDGDSYIWEEPSDAIARAWKEAINVTRWTP